MGKQEHKVNIKARIDRHSRIIKENLLFNNKIFSAIQKNKITTKILFVLILFIIPVYPMFAGMIHNSNGYNFYRQYIDEDSILAAYDNSSIEELSNGEILESNNEFILDSSLLNEDRDSNGKEIRTYKVRPGDSISLIASKFKVTKDTIYAYNNLAKNHILKPGESLKIPSISGIPYKVKHGDNLIKIAKKYDIDTEKILEYNNLKGKKLLSGKTIFLPGAKIIVETKIKKSSGKKYASNTNVGRKKSYTYSSSKKTNTTYAPLNQVYKLKRRKPYSGAWGNCTYYVASYKNVNWRGNANQWMRNAAKKGHKVVYGRGFKPKLGSIIVFSGRGYNPYYGHVGIVMELRKNYMIISDMNYRKLNEVTYRRIKYNDRAIVGYIYID